MKSVTITMTIGDDWVIPVEFYDENNQPWSQEQMESVEWDAKYAYSENAPSWSFEIRSIEDNVLTLALPSSRTRSIGRARRIMFTVRGVANKGTETEHATTYVTGIIQLRRAAV